MTTPQGTSSRRLQRSILLFSVVAIVATAAAVAFMSLVPYRQSLVAAQHQKLDDHAARRAQAVHARLTQRLLHASRLSRQTRQAGSELADIHSPAELANWQRRHRPTLETMLLDSQPAVGLVLLDPSGQEALRSGPSLPLPQNPTPTQADPTLRVGVSRTSTRWYLVVYSPCSEAELTAQTTLVVFYDSADLQELVDGEPLPWPSAGATLVRLPERGPGLPLAGVGQDGHDEPETGPGLAPVTTETWQRLRKGQPVEPLTNHPTDAVALARVPSVDWALALHAPRRETLAEVDAQVWRMLAIASVFAAAGVALCVLAIRPLAGKVLLRADEMQSIILEKTATLNEELVERKRISEELRRSEQRLRQVIDLVPHRIFAKDIQGRFVLANQATAESHGTTVEEITGRLQSEVHGVSAEVDRYLEDDRQVIESGQAKFIAEETFVDAHGQTRILQTTKIPLVEGDQDPVVLGVSVDITDVKRSEEALAFERYLLDCLMLHGKDYIYFKDAKGRFIRVSEPLATKYGLDDPRKAIGKSDADFFGDDFARVTGGEEQAVMDACKPLINHEERLVWPDGQVGWVSSTKMPLMDARGNVIGTFGISRDITAQKMVEQALKDNERKYHSLFSTVSEGIALHELVRDETGQAVDYRLLDVNRAYEELTGIPRDRAIGALASQIYDMVRPPFLDVYEEVSRTQKPQTFESYFEPLDRYFQVSAFCPERGKFATVFSDVTERRRNEEKIRRLNALLQAIRNVNQLIVQATDRQKLLDEACRMIVESRGYFSALAVTVDDQGQLTHSAEAGLDPDDFAQVVDRVEAGDMPGPMRAALQCANVVIIKNPEDLTGLCPVGQETSAEALCLRFAHTNTVYGVLVVTATAGLAIDTEEQSLLQELAGDVALALHKIGLEHDRHRAEREAQALEEQLNQAMKMEAIGRLAGGIAHDFNNQLTVIKGYCDLLLRNVDDQAPHKGPMVEIQRAAQRAATLTSQLLTFSRRQMLAPQVINLDVVLGEMSDPLSRMIGEDMELSIIHSGQETAIEVDRGHLEQAVMNLTINARDAMPEGGKITIETSSVYLDSDYTSQHAGVEPGMYVMLAISDTGVGMDEPTREKIFEPFFTTKPMGQGTGLGLAMVYGFVKQSNGIVYVYSELDQGTTFKIYLPQATKPVQSFHLDEDEEFDVEGDETILVSEDEEAVRQIVVKVLRGYGYTVLETANAKEALPLGEHYESKIHMLVTDVIMPGMSGPELVEKLRPIRPEMKVLYITGYAENAVARHGVLEGDVNLLTKPFTPRQLAGMVRKVLDHAKANPTA